MESEKIYKQSNSYSDNDYITGLKKGDSAITRSFFYTLCNFTLNDIRWSLMQGRLDYDELVNELYLYLSVNNWHKLDTFEGKNNCSIKSWVVTLAWRFFMQNRTKLLYGECVDYGKVGSSMATNDHLNLDIAMDVESTFSRMTNQRYVQVLKWMLIDGYEAEDVAKFLNTLPANVYNIKHRAILQFVKTYNC